MKKVYIFLFLLITLSLFDGTPIHRHHGKFISQRCKTYLNVAVSTDAATTIVLGEVDDTDNEDDSLTTTLTNFQSFEVKRAHFASLYLTDYISSGLDVPLYKLTCDFRI